MIRAGSASLRTAASPSHETEIGLANIGLGRALADAMGALMIAIAVGAFIIGAVAVGANISMGNHDE